MDKIIRDLLDDCHEGLVVRIVRDESGEYGTKVDSKIRQGDSMLADFIAGNIPVVGPFLAGPGE